MTREEAASCINTIVILKNLCYRVRGLMDVIDAQNCDKIIEMLNTVGETHKKHTETHACDTISRQGALDIERRATVDTNPKHFESHQKFVEFMDDAEISSFGRWQWSNGFNTALTAVGIDLKRLPSAQPELIRCKYCKHSEH